MTAVKTCEENGCTFRATAVLSPHTAPRFVCRGHAEKAFNIGASMGMHITVAPLEEAEPGIFSVHLK